MIAAYLSKLAGALAFDPALAARVVIEAREHLTDAAAEDACVDRDEAERARWPTGARCGSNSPMPCTRCSTANDRGSRHDRRLSE